MLSDMFERLALSDPLFLLALIRSGELTDDLRAIAVRAFGAAHDSVCVAPLLELIGSPSDALREGAVLALRKHARSDSDNYRARQALTDLRDTEDSPRVQLALNEVLR